MNNLEKIKQRLRANWQVPVITLALTLLSYALLLPALHYYLDDWPNLYSLYVRGVEGIKQLYLYDGRPFAYLITLFFYRLCGLNPILWHLSNYILRWMTGLFLWGAFNQIWPAHKREVYWVVILFSVYPLLAQQSMGLTIIVVLASYLLYAISLFLMASAFRSKKFQWPLIFFSVVVGILAYFNVEYFIGLELLRPLIIWLILAEKMPNKTRVKQTLRYWLPFLASAIFYVFWRLFLLVNLRKSNTPVMFTDLLHDPITTTLQLGNFVLRDTVTVILGVWFPAFDPAIFDLTSASKNLAIILTALVIGVFLFVLLKQKNEQEVSFNDENKSKVFWLQSLFIGLAGVILGCAPGWLIGRSISDTYGLWNDRFGLAAMFGASLFIIGISGLIAGKNRLKWEIFLVILVGFAVGRNFSVTDEYRWSSVWQNEFYSQLKWRAPYIKSGTSILADNEMFPKMGVYATSFAINMLYPSVEPMPRTDYWFFTLHRYFPGKIDQLAEGIPVSQGHWYATFEGESQNSLVIAWQNGASRCVWVLTENDRYNPFLSPNTVAALGASNLDRIDPSADPSLPSEDLFGEENRNTWCYYYETADLARQVEHWDAVTSLYDEAEEKGFEPANGIELMPFIEGYARTGNPEKSLELTIWAAGLTDNIAPYLCNNLNRIAANLSEEQHFQDVFESFFYDYSCSVLGQ